MMILSIFTGVIFKFLVIKLKKFLNRYKKCPLIISLTRYAIGLSEAPTRRGRATRYELIPSDSIVSQSIAGGEMIRIASHFIKTSIISIFLCILAKFNIIFLRPDRLFPVTDEFCAIPPSKFDTLTPSETDTFLATNKI